MMNKQKTEKKSFKERIMKVLFVVLVGFMIFGAMRSCVKVKAITYDVTSGTYIWDLDIFYEGSFLTDSYPLTFNYDVTLESNNESYPYILSNLASYNDTQYKYLRFNYSDFRDEHVTPNINGYEVVCSYGNDTFTDVFWIRYYRSGNDWIIHSFEILDTQLLSFYLIHTDLRFVADSWFNVSPVGLFETITTKIFSDTDSVSYQNAYQLGYADGSKVQVSQVWDEAYQKGLTEGISQGLADTSNPLLVDAYDSGLQEGKAIGRQEGLLEGNDYTFRGLMFAVLQAPVTVFSGLFNWDFLGYNLKDFFFTCLTMACIIAIVRRFI